MPFSPPALDDRSFQDLVEEMLARIPAHTPEWTNPRPGDPGRTLIELFAWLADTILYRANLIPERQRLVFLKLLGASMKPAVPARGIVTVSNGDEQSTAVPALRLGSEVKGPVRFETLSELNVLPVSAQVYCKRAMPSAEADKLTPVLAQLKALHQLPDLPTPYQTSALFPAGTPDPTGIDLMTDSVDHCLWFALLASTQVTPAAIRKALAPTPQGEIRYLSVGILPALEVPPLTEQIGNAARVPHVWEISSSSAPGEARYSILEPVADSTLGLTRRGVFRLALPPESSIGAPPDDVRQNLEAGLGDRPPRLDDAALAARLVAWVRLRPLSTMTSLAISWAGINAVEVDQRETVRNRVVGTSDGSPDQQFSLTATSVDEKTLVLDVEESNSGFVTWQTVDDLGVAAPGDRVFRLDPEAGTATFGDGVHGRVVEVGRRVRVASMRAGGGQAGNLPPGALTQIVNPRDIRNQVINATLKVQQTLQTEGGEDAETFPQAERRIPSLFRHGDRAVTAEDFQRIAAETQGVRMGRVEVRPRFKPQQRMENVPGVVSVVALPFKPDFSPPCPRPDRTFLETVHGYVLPRCPVTTELYVIGAEYMPMAASVGVTLRDGFAQEVVFAGVREALRIFLWPLAPGGIDGAGWAFGRSVVDRELAAVVARVPGVDRVGCMHLYDGESGIWHKVAQTSTGQCTLAERTLRSWQLPELLAVIVSEGNEASDSLEGVSIDGGTAGTGPGLAVPIVPEMC